MVIDQHSAVVPDFSPWPLRGNNSHSDPADHFVLRRLNILTDDRLGGWARDYERMHGEAARRERQRRTGRAPAKTAGIYIPWRPNLYACRCLLSVLCSSHFWTTTRKDGDSIQCRATTLAASLTHTQISLSLSLSFARTGMHIDAHTLHTRQSHTSHTLLEERTGRCCLASIAAASSSRHEECKCPAHTIQLHCHINSLLLFRQTVVHSPSFSSIDGGQSPIHTHTWASFRLQIGSLKSTVPLLFVFVKYCSIMD
jgi:hypothetical protein